MSRFTNENYMDKVEELKEKFPTLSDYVDSMENFFDYNSDVEHKYLTRDFY